MEDINGGDASLDDGLNDGLVLQMVYEIAAALKLPQHYVLHDKGEVLEHTKYLNPGDMKSAVRVQPR